MERDLALANLAIWQVGTTTLSSTEVIPVVGLFFGNGESAALFVSSFLGIASMSEPDKVLFFVIESMAAFQFVPKGTPYAIPAW